MMIQFRCPRVGQTLTPPEESKFRAVAFPTCVPHQVAVLVLEGEVGVFRQSKDKWRANLLQMLRSPE